MLTMRRLIVVGLVGTAVALAGCGTTTTSGSPRKTVNDYFEDIANGNYKAACGELAPGMSFSIASAVIDAKPTQLSLITAAANDISPHALVGRCAGLLSAITAQGQLQTNELRFVKTAIQAHGAKAYVKVSDMPNTADLVVDIAPNFITVTHEKGAWRITELG